MKARLIVVIVGGALGVSLLTSATVAGQAGSPQERLSDKEVIALLDGAKTSADHAKLATYFEQEAKDFEAKATKHKALAASYRRRPAAGNPRAQTPASLAGHCEEVATEATKAAKAAGSMAEHHRMMAKDLMGK
jgi:hypothetical protein